MSAGKIITGIGAALVVFAFFMSTNVNAECSREYCPPEVHHDHHDVIDGKDGKDGESITGAPGRDGRDFSGEVFNDNRLSRGIAITGAMSSIPALSHVGTHNHTGVGASVSSYGNQNAIAIGWLHQEQNRSYKATIGLSGSETLVGAGASFAFK